MSYERLTDEELDAILKDLDSMQRKSDFFEAFYRAVRELAEYRQAAEAQVSRPLPEDYWESAQ